MAITDAHGNARMNDEQVLALVRLSRNYGVLFREDDYTVNPFDLPDGWVSGSVGGRLFVGCSPAGECHS